MLQLRYTLLFTIKRLMYVIIISHLMYNDACNAGHITINKRRNVRNTR